MIGLTEKQNAAMLNLSISRSIRIAVLESNGASRHLCGFFMREIFSVLHNVGLGRAAARLAGPFVRYCNPIQSGAHDCSHDAGFKAFTNGVNLMTNQPPRGNTAQNPTQFHSLFNLIKRTATDQRVICENLTFAQASSLVSEIPAAIVKFSRMEALS